VDIDQYANTQVCIIVTNITTRLSGQIDKML